MSEYSDGEYEESGSGESSVVDDALAIKDNAMDLKDKTKDLKNKWNEQHKNGDVKNNNAARNANKATNEGTKKVANEGTKKAANEGTKKAANEGAKKVAAEGAKKAASEGAKKAAKEGTKQAVKAGTKAAAKGAATAAKTGVKAAVTGTKVVAGTAVKFVPYVGWALAIADVALTAVKITVDTIKLGFKIRKKVEKKVKEKTDVDVTALRRIFEVSPLIILFSLIALVFAIIFLLMYSNTTNKTDALRDAVACAESSGCTDFMNTGITISSASAPLSGLAGTIVAFYGETLDAIDQQKNIKFTNALNEAFDEQYSKDLIYFTDLQIARLVIEYLMVENKYFGFTDTLIGMIDTMATEANGVEGEDKEIIDWLFELLVKNKIIANAYEAYSLFNWLKLEKVAFNKIKWQVYYTGISGTGSGFIDDTLKNFCTDTTIGRVSQNLTDFCKENKTTKSITFKVIGDINPFTSNLYVPTTLWSAGDAAINAADVFGITDKLSLLQSWKAQSLPDQDQLIAAVEDFLPSWVEIYAAYTSTRDLAFANKVYKYYVDNLGTGGDFEVNVSLYALRTYSVETTKDLGDKTVKYNIYGSDGNLISYNENGTTKYAENISEDEMKEFVGSGKNKDYNTVSCTDSDYKNGTGGCKKAVTTYTDGENNKVSCTDSDYNTGAHGCTRGQATKKVEYTFWEKIKNFAKGLEEALRQFWAKAKEILATGWYYASNIVQDFINTKYPLTFASERNWAISVTKGSTFDAMYNWTYDVKTHRSVEEVKEVATSGFDNDVAMKKVDNNKVTNTATTSGTNVISKTIVAKTDDLKVEQIIKYTNVIKEVTTWDEMLEMTSSQEKEYVVKKLRAGGSGTTIEDYITYDNRLAYVIEKISADSSNSFVVNSDDLIAAYDAIRTYKGKPYTSTGVHTDYSTLPTGSFGWPLEEIERPVLTSCTGLRGTVLGSGTENHGGDDIAAPKGTKILAAKAGKVITNQFMASGYGYYVIIDHGDGWYTLYGHMVRQSSLGVGTKVEAGQVIGYVGTTGRSTGYHLHFETRYGTTGGFWSAKKKEPLYLIDKNTMPSQLYANSDAGCPDKNDWGM